MAAGEDVSIDGAWRLSATSLSGMFRSGAIKPDAHLEQLLERIERLDRDLNAVVAIDPTARAAAAASAARYRKGTALGELDGVPVAIKDNILVQGMPTTWGSRALREHICAVDELPVARLRAQGALIIGKTNCPEFTLDGHTSNLLFGTTRNPWDTELTPGGSSGGAVAGVAAGLFPLALGTDGGGSTRRPASHTGLVGFKPSIGAIARFPTVPQILLDFEVIGPIARTVGDVALLYNATCGPDLRDRTSLTARAGLVRSDGAVAPLRILYVPRIDDNALDPEIERSVSDAASLLGELGHRVEVGALPFDLSAIVEFWPLLGQVGVAHLFERWPQAAVESAPRFAEMAEAGRRVPAPRYFRGLETIREFRATVADAFEHFDLLMTPSAAALPWPADEAYPTQIDGREVGPRGHAVYTGWVNACGHPAINLPSAPSEGGLPIGFQLVAAYGRDELLLQVGEQYERAYPFHRRWPAIAMSV